MMLEMPTEEASKAIRLSEPASGSRCGGDAIKSATGKKAAKKGSRLSERASGSSGDGDAIKAQKLAEGDKAEAGKVKRMGLVSQKYIASLIEEEDAGGPTVPNFDFLDKCAGSDDPILRALAARTAACMENVRAHDADILKQYHEKGHAYAEMEEEPFDIEKLWIVKATRKTLLASP